jgi:glycerophosphoryl diester phosphodiesterase
VRDGVFHLRNANRGGEADVSFRYGRSGDVAIVGDWNRDGRTTVGVVRGNAFHLRNANRGGEADVTFHFGRAGDVPLAGDWNGDGATTVGVRRGSTFHLRNTNRGGEAEVSFTYGRASDTPVAGDWNRNGYTTVGVVRGDTWMLRDALRGGSADHVFHYGQPTDLPVVGDWNRDGATTIGVARQHWAAPVRTGVIAHRGASCCAPENTMSAFDLATEHDAPMIEFDVRVTADGDLAAIHDATLKRTTNAADVYPDREPWLVNDFTAAEIAELDAGSWFAPEWAGEPVPMLADVLDADVGVPLVIDAKFGDAVELLADALPEGRDDLVVQSFDRPALEAFAQQRPDVPVWVMRSGRPRVAEVDWWATFATGASVRHDVLDEQSVPLHDRGLLAVAWTVNDPAEARRLAGVGVDWVITDYPADIYD